MYIRYKMMVIDAIKEKNVNLNSFLFVHSETFYGACKTFSKCLFITLKRPIYKYNLETRKYAEGFFYCIIDN